MIEINLSHWELTLQHDADGSQPMSEATKNRLEQVKGFHAKLNHAEDKDELEVLRNDFWQSPTIGHFDKMALDPVYWERSRQLEAKKSCP
jgi:hypothetical protein